MSLLIFYIICFFVSKIVLLFVGDDIIVVECLQFIEINCDEYGVELAKMLIWNYIIDEQ